MNISNKNVFIVILCGTLALPSSILANNTTSRMSVERLLRLVEGTPFSPPLPGWPASLAPRLAKEQAQLYVSGVIDSGEGRLWCVGVSKMPPHEANEAIFKALRGKSSSNAALAIAEVLSRTFPCKN